MGHADGEQIRGRCISERTSIIALVLVYVALSLAFSLRTRAFEADDEAAHTQYIEYIVGHGALPRISVANGGESHQPPLYYALAAGWQRLLGIPYFSPVIVPAKHSLTPNSLMLSHNYNPTQHQDAVYLHELRLLSVLLTYAGATVFGLSAPLCLSSGLFVALLPRELVISSDVTNDALAIPLCALALVLYLLSERARAERRNRSRRFLVLGMGLVLGAAAITKFTSLPVAVVLIGLCVVPSMRVSHRLLGSPPPRGSLSATPLEDDSSTWQFEPRLLLDAFIALAGFLAVSGWWFLRNRRLYGQFLATNKSEHYLPPLFFHPLRWDAHLFLNTFPHALFSTTWYAQPNLLLPFWMNLTLASVGILCLVIGAWAITTLKNRDSSWLSRLPGLALPGCVIAGLIAVFVNLKETSIGDARLAFVGLSAFAILLVAGSARLSAVIFPSARWVGVVLWPIIFIGIDIFVLIRFVVPLGGL
jgi:Dolichyl-phosphate-mannose-protein mannosyltransferase